MTLRKKRHDDVASEATSSIVTHVILTYNDIEYLIRAIQYSINQNEEVEKDILIIDDGSIEPAEPILRKIYDFESHKIRVIRNHVNIGIYPSVKRAIEDTHTKYIYLASCNDQITPGFFSNNIYALEKNDSAAFSFSDPGIYYEKLNRYANFPLYLTDTIKYLEPLQFVKLYRGNPFHIGSNTVVYRTENLKEIGFQEDLGLYADWFTIYFLAFSKGGVYTPKILSYYCVHENSYSSTQQTNDNSDLVIKFFSYTKAMSLSVFEKYKIAGFISAFPFLEILRILKTPIILEVITTRSLCYSVVRSLWNSVNKMIPTGIRNTLRRKKSENIHI